MTKRTPDQTERDPSLQLLRLHWRFHEGTDYLDCLAPLCVSGKAELVAWLRQRKAQAKEQAPEPEEATA